MNWAVEIRHSGLDRRNLRDLLLALDFQVVDGIDCLAFTSADMNAMQSTAEIWALAKKLRSAMLSPSNVDPHFELGAVIDFTTVPPKRCAILEPETINLTTIFGSANLTVSRPLGMSIEQNAKWEADCQEREYQVKLESQRFKLEAVFNEPRARQVLELLNLVTQDGATLYKIYELAEEHPTKRSQFQKGMGISKGEFDRFKDTVHNPAVTGDWARHAYSDPPKTLNPMTISEAEVFVREIAWRWLATLRASDRPAQ